MNTPSLEEIWNQRYEQVAYAYGEEPNEFFKAQLETLSPGKILLPAEGEGRNAVYAATKGWVVTALDISEAGKTKALALAEKHKVQINYKVADMGQVSFPEATFDALDLVYAHFPVNVKSAYHQQLASYLKIGGIVIFEAFSKSHVSYQTENPAVGGPKSLEMLFSIEELENDFKGFEFYYLKEEIVDLNEGLYHKGKGAVIRMVGKKCQ
jgi:SAM-dependent methyltransferase